METASIDSYQDDQGDSRSVTSCSSSYSNESELPWLSCIESDGSLFYVQHESHHLDCLSEDYVKHSISRKLDAHNKSKKSAAHSIKRWVKEHGKTVKKFLPLFKPPRTNTMSIYVSRDIFIEAEPIKSNEIGADFSESLLGIRLGSENETYQPFDKVCVKGFLAGSYVPDVDIGDWVKSINDVDINCGNLENILEEISLPSTVKLTLMTLQKSMKNLNARERHDNLAKELSGDPVILEKAKLMFQNLQYGVFFFSLKDKMMENDDIIYCYPGECTEIFQLKGLFLTLSLMIDDVATPPLLSSSIVVKDQLVHIAFIKEEESLLALVFPAKIATVEEVQLFCSSLAKLFRYLFSSLERAFSSEGNKKYLDNFLTSFFKHYLSSSQKDNKNNFESYLLDILPSAKWIPLPNDVLTEVDSILSELESADFGSDSGGFYKNQRILNIHGCCLFYKGFLISSTLQKDDLLDIHLYLHFSHVLELTELQPVTELIIWREIFPSRLRECCQGEFEISACRWFLNVVAVEQFVLAVVFSDGGCAFRVTDQPSPEPFYVQEVTNALFVLEASGILSAIEERTDFSKGLLSGEINSLSSTFTSNVSLNSSGPNLSSDCSASYSSLGMREGSSGKNCSSLHSSFAGSADGESDSSSKYFDSDHLSPSLKCRSASQSTIESCESPEVKTMKNQTAQNFSSSLPNLTHCSSDSIFLQYSVKMASHIGKRIFYYLHMDPVEGVYTSFAKSMTLPHSVDQNIVMNFYKMCLKMRVIFERSLRNSQIFETNAKTKYGVNKFPLHAEEQGFSFLCKRPNSEKKKSSKPLQFWVVGRLFFAPEPREVYVCYLSDVPHDVIELAFHLGFGLSF